jgi:hypothetical protein
MAKKGILKGELNKLLVAERKKMRIVAKESLFKKRTLNIFKNQVVRAAELNLMLSYDIEALRKHVKDNLQTCGYCSKPLTVNSFVCDHMLPVSRDGQFTLDNLKVCCKNCNNQKGILTDTEFNYFNDFITTTFPPVVIADIRMRLSTGGKWSGKT